MPVLTLFQTKGGTGKTTAAFVLGELLAKQNTTTIIDADLNEPFREWELGGGTGQGFDIIAFKERDDKGRPTGRDVDRLKAVPEAIKQATKGSVFVIVDTEGSANAVSARAVSMSDLVIITSTGSPLDQKHASNAIKFVRAQSKQIGRDIPYRVLFTRQKAVAVSRTIKKGMANMIDAGVPIFQQRLIERDAFMAIFGYNAPLFNLPNADVSDPHKGYFNGKVWSNEVMRVLSGEDTAPPKAAKAKPTEKPASAAKTKKEKEAA